MWYNRQTDDSKVPTLSFRKGAIQNWLEQRNIEYESVLTNAELLEIEAKFISPRRYKVNKIERMWVILICFL